MKQRISSATIVDSVLQSRKYGSIYRPAIERIVETLSGRYPPKQLEHEVKRKLHQFWGAYFTRPDFEKLLEKVRYEYSIGADPKEMIKPLLLLQTSTAERIPVLPEFYQRMFKVTGIPRTVVEYGCGMNALTYPWMERRVKYIGIDVDTGLMDFLNDVFGIIRVDDHASVQLGDILEEKYIDTDVTLLLKVLVLFERQADGVSRTILEQIPSRFIVVSFPTKSMSGRERGMKKHYTELFAELVAGTGWRTEMVEFESELVFVIEKK